jgi:hypothetical protein
LRESDTKTLGGADTSRRCSLWNASGNPGDPSEALGRFAARRARRHR